MHIRNWNILIALFPALLCAHISSDDTPIKDDDLPYKIWYTGTYLAATTVNINAIEPFFSAFAIYGMYNEDWKVKRKETTWSLNPALELIFTISSKVGIELTGGLLSNHRGDKHATHFTDTALTIGYEVLKDDKDSWVPNFRLALNTLLPTGHYKKLDPKKFGIDISGTGSYFFGPLLAFSKTFRFPCHFMNLYWSFGYLFPTYAYIKGVNAYGGSPDTRGRIRPGQLLTATLSAEYSLSHPWVFAIDFELLHQTATSHFSGRRGVLAPGIPAIVGQPSSTSFSIAPQIEYNFSEKSGLLFGAWCSVAGRNSRAFAAAIFAYIYVF